MGFVNDIPAFHNMGGTAFNTTVPINHLLMPEKNSFRVEIFPGKELHNLLPRTDCKAEILTKLQQQLAQELTSIASCEFPEGTSTEEKPLPGFVISSIFKTELPFEKFAWVNSPTLKNNEKECIKLGIEYYRMFYNALKQKKLDVIFEEIKEREREMSIAFYDDYETEFEKTQQLFKETVSDKNWEIQPFTPEKFLCRFYANKQIFALEDTHYDQPIQYYNKLLKKLRQFPLYLCLNAQNEFIIIR